MLCGQVGPLLASPSLSRVPIHCPNQSSQAQDGMAQRKEEEGKLAQICSPWREENH